MEDALSCLHATTLASVAIASMLAIMMKILQGSELLSHFYVPQMILGIIYELLYAVYASVRAFFKRKTSFKGFKVFL